MNTIWGAVLVIFTLFIGWLVQVINAAAPKFAARLGFGEPESAVDRTFFLETRGESIWDALILWTLPLAGILLILNHPWWAYFGLVGGGMYLYFAGRGIIVRRLLQRNKIKIGRPQMLAVYYAGLALWGIIGLVTIVLALNTLSG
jgi:hypothetical protein